MTRSRSVAALVLAVALSLLPGVLGADGAPAVNASTPAQPAANAKMMSPQETSVRELIAALLGSIVNMAPISVSIKDTPETLRQIAEHNARWLEICSD